MPSAALPAELQQKLEHLGRHVRRWRFTAGAGRFTAAALVGLVAAVALDAFFELPSFVRGGLLGVWLFGTAVAAYVWLWQPWFTRPDPRDLACAVEQLHPRLGERLSSAVELSTVEGDFGSPELVRLLLHEADLKTRALDFDSAAPSRSAGWVLAAAAPVLVGVAALALWNGERSLEYLARLVVPWREPPPPYQILVTPGDATVAPGRPLTFAVELRPVLPNVQLPNAATLLLSDPTGRASRLALAPASQPNRYEYSFVPPAGRFTYQIEAGRARSSEFTVRVVEPVHLAADSPAATITPPGYARGQLEEQTVTGVQDLSGLLFSRVDWEWKFDRPATDARLKVLGLASLRAEPARLRWSDDKRSLRLELFAAAPHGSVQLTIVGESGVTTELPEQPVRGLPDDPPAFAQVRGLNGSTRIVSPSDSIPLEIHVTDDFGVASLAVEYRVGPAEIRETPIEVEPGRDVKAAHRWKLSDKAVVGETIEYRLRATDNRRVPEFEVSPNVTYFPPGDRWAVLRVADKAESFGKQEAMAQRAQSDRAVRDLIEALKREARALYSLHTDIARNRTVREEEEPRLADLRDMNQEAVRQLEALAEQAEPLDGLQPLAAELRETAETMKDAGEWIREAGARAEKQRIDPLKTAEREVEAARQRLEKLPQLTEQLVKEQLEREQLARLADQQEQLAEKAERAESQREQQRLEQQERELLEQLRRATEQSQPLREAMEQSAPEAMAQLAEKAKQLAAAEQALDEKAAEQQRKADEQQAGQAGRQRELAERIDELGRKSQTAAKAAQAEPAKPETARRAADAIDKGEPHHAAGLQEQAARELDRLAEQLDRANAQATKSPAEAVRQLARAQEAVRQQLPKTEGGSPEAAAAKEQARRDQQQIRASAGQLPKPADPKAEQLRADSLDKLDQAARALDGDDRSAADRQMSQARQALEKLAGVMGQPTDGPAAPSLAKPELAQAARDLAGQQRRLMEQSREAARQRDREGTNPESVRRDQQELQRQAEQLAQEMGRAGQQLPESARPTGSQAEQAARQAAGHMNTAGNTRDARPAAQARQKAMEQLRRAAEQATQAARAGRPADADAPPDSQSGEAQAGGSIRNAQDQMNQARRQLGQGESQQASESMRQAADALRQALDQLNQSMRDRHSPDGGRPAETASAETAPPADQLPPVLRDHAGKKWGELPGELRTRIVQELKAQYGDDYARVIKHYFEQLADRKAP